MRCVTYCLASVEYSGYGLPDRFLCAHTTQKVNYTVDPEFNLNYVKEYCTEEEVDTIILYYPIVLLVSALVLIAIDKIFVAVFKSGQEKKKLYRFVCPYDGSRISNRGKVNT